MHVVCEREAYANVYYVDCLASVSADPTGKRAAAVYVSEFVGNVITRTVAKYRSAIHGRSGQQNLNTGAYRRSGKSAEYVTGTYVAQLSESTATLSGPRARTGLGRG
jgi:hypothetical protein